MDQEYAPTTRAITGQHPIWELAKRNNQQKVVIVDRVNGVKVKTTEGYRKCVR